MRLNDPLITTYIYNDTVIPIDLSFDNVLDVFDIVETKGLYDFQLAEICLVLLFGDGVIDEVDCLVVWNDVFETFLNPPSEQYIEYDVEGNPMPKKKEKKLIDLSKDAEYIYASFLQSYQMNLFIQQTKLHWSEFKALLNGLPENTIMKQIIHIRGWKASKDDSKEYKESMERLQDMYSLEDPEEEEVD